MTRLRARGIAGMLAVGMLAAGMLAAGMLAFAAPAAAQQGLQLDPPDTLEPPPRASDDLQLQPPGQGFQLPNPTTVDDEAYDDALDDMLDDPWPDEETDGDFDEPLEGEGSAADSLAEQGLDPETDALLEEEFGPVDGEAHEGEHEGEHAPGADHEAEHGAHEFDPIAFLATVVNFLIWLAVVVWLGRKPVSEYLKNRRLAVEEGLEEAKRLSAQAREKHAEYSQKLDRLDEELEKLRAEMIRAGEGESARTLADAEARAERMRKDARFLVEQQMKQLRVDLTREAIEAAVAAAEQVLTSEIAPADQQRLADSYLEKVAETMDDGEVRA